MKRFRVVFIVLLAVLPIQFNTVQAQSEAPVSALEEAQEISRLTGRPMFVVAGRST